MTATSKISRRSIVTSMLCALALPCAPAMAVEGARHASSMRSLLEQTGIPGMTFAVFGAGLDRSDAAGLADREARTSMRPTTLMMGASTGKMIVAVLIYQEIQAQRLRLDDKVSRYLGDDAEYMKLPGAADFTIAMLLSHSSGLVDGAVDYAAMENSSGIWTSDRRFRAAQKTKLLFPPGSRYSYSDLNYQVLAAVLERIEGKSYEQLAVEKVLLPLQMRHTVPALHPHIAGLASGYAGPTTKPQYEGIHLPDKTASAGTLFMNPAFEGGGGGFATCSHDMAKFIFTVFNGGLIDAAQLHHMTGEDAVLPVQTEFPRVAAGVFAYKTPLGEAFGHSGLWFGYKTLVLYFPERKLGAAMQVNSQIDASGADLEVFRMEGKEFTMVEALSQLVLESTASTNGARS
jgi:D-alanyl-D-alanine carboxypeptidase